MLGTHTVKWWSTNHAVLALSSGEAEYYAIVKAASVALGIRSLAADLGIKFECAIAIKSDASAAIGVEISDDLVDGFCRHCGHGGQIWLEATGYPADHDQILVVAARVVD